MRKNFLLALAFFMGLSLAACGPQPLTPSATMPAALVGKWIQRTGTGTSYQNLITGSFGAPNASTFQYVFEPNGHYTHAALLSSSLYNCTLQIFGHEQGNVLADDHRLTLSPASATLHVDDNCNADGTGDRPGKTDVETYSWRVETGDNGERKLILTWSNGWEEVFVPDLDS